MRKRKDVQRELDQQLQLMRTLHGNKDKETEYRAAMDQVQALTEELNQINVDEAAQRAIAASSVSESTREKARQFSFAKFFREVGSPEGLTGVEAEMATLANDEAVRAGVKLIGVGIPSVVLNMRAFEGMAAGTPSDGGAMISSTMQYQEELRKRLVLAKAGVQYLGGLVGNIDLISGKAIQASWEGENVKVGDSKKQFSKRSFSPKRLALTVPISKQLIAQSSWDVERMILNDILLAHAEALETAAINGSGVGQPTGILNTVGIGSVVMGANGSAPTFKSMVDLETQVSIQNADLGALAYLTNSKVRGAMKTTLKAAGVSGYIWEKDEVNGYRAFASNIVPSNISKGNGTDLSAAIFGNFNDMLIGQWGGLDIVYDPYTMATEGAIRITLNVYHDVFVRRPESFAAAKDIVA